MDQQELDYLKYRAEVEKDFKEKEKNKKHSIISQPLPGMARILLHICKRVKPRLIILNEIRYLKKIVSLTSRH